jgi:hypothetical protein
MAMSKNPSITSFGRGSLAPKISSFLHLQELRATNALR